MTTRDLLPDWSLLPFEVELAKTGYKNLFILPEGCNVPTELYHTNGMTFAVRNVFKSRLRDLGDVQRLMFGVKYGVIPASCEHPDFECPYYGTKWNSGTEGTKGALIEFCKENPDVYNFDKEYYFIETLYYPFDQAKLESPRSILMHEFNTWDTGSVFYNGNYSCRLPKYQPKERRKPK